LLHFLLLAAFGIWIPHLKGIDFLDSQVLGAYACLGLIFAAPATAQSFVNAESVSFQQAMSRIVVGILYGEAAVAAILGTAIATVYLSNRGAYVPTPDWTQLARSASFGFGVSAMLASMAAFVAVRFSRTAAMICLRAAFFGLLILFFYRGQWLPEIGFAPAAACLAIAGLFVGLLRRSC
jgi:hypothetical protein